MKKVMELIGDWRGFLEKLIEKCQQAGLDIQDREIDHVCYRTESLKEYVAMRDQLTRAGCPLILESMVGGRPISVFELSRPLEYCHWKVRCLELASPKVGRNHGHGLEHAEVVIGKGVSASFNSKDMLETFVSTCPPSIAFDYKAINKSFNADVCVDLGDNINVKFHAASLYDVCSHEVESGRYDPVPADYFQNALL
jgi:predicted metalloenzyme YecM